MPFQFESKYVALKRRRPSSQSERIPISVLSMTSGGRSHNACSAIGAGTQSWGRTAVGPILTNGRLADVKPSAYVRYTIRSSVAWNAAENLYVLTLGVAGSSTLAVTLPANGSPCGRIDGSGVRNASIG